jgi:hypothetical protein
LIKEGKIITINTPVHIIDSYKGKLYSLKPEAIFTMLNCMQNCSLTCNYYPYGEFMHVSFYDADFDLQHFTHFLEINHQNFSELTQITPTIEDCFIELVTTPQ